MRINGLSEAAAELMSPRTTSKSSGASFTAALESSMAKAGNVRFSNHAQQRLDARNIELTPQDVERIAQSTDDAMTKGAKESLILMDRLALVVGVPNRTVITVMEPHERSNTVFTNIDSVVVVPKDAPSVQEN